MCRRLYRFTITVWTLLTGAFVHVALADVGKCGGADMIAEMAQTNPVAFEKINAEAKALENTEALLWRIEKPDTPASYLFGTVHLSDARVTSLSAAASDAFKNAKTVVLEVGDLSPSALAAAMTSAKGIDLVYAGGRTLSEKLSAEEFAKVKSVVAASGLPAETAKVLKPWLVSTLLSVSDCERKQAAAGAKVLDMQLGERAKAAGIPVEGLETIQQQLSALSSIPEDQQIQMLRVSLKHYERTDDMMETMLQLYLKRDMGKAMPFQTALAEEMGISASAFDGFQKSLLVDRNARMSKAAAPYLDKGHAFIAVGALHLPGKTGLVHLLREAGYKVVPLE